LTELLLISPHQVQRAPSTVNQALRPRWGALRLKAITKIAFVELQQKPPEITVLYHLQGQPPLPGMALAEVVCQPLVVAQRPVVCLWPRQGELFVGLEMFLPHLDGRQNHFAALFVPVADDVFIDPQLGG